MSKLSIRNLLESNGVEFGYYDICLNIDCDCATYQVIKINDIEYEYLCKTKEKIQQKILEEKASRQYLIENGIKLKLFNEELQNAYKSYKEYYITQNLPHNSSILIKDMMLSPQVPMVVKWFKLFAWLYANDIEIKETE